MTFDIRRAFADIIRKYENPVAPLALQGVYSAIQNLAPILASKASQPETEYLGDRLMSTFNEEELERISGTPEFAIALMGMLSETLVKLAR